MSKSIDWSDVTDLKRRPHSYLFATALREDSNLAMDWLWLASLLEDEQERQYCLQRAHYIDPACVVVHTQPGFATRFKIMIQTALKRQTAANERSEEQLPANL